MRNAHGAAFAEPGNFEVMDDPVPNDSSRNIVVDSRRTPTSPNSYSMAHCRFLHRANSKISRQDADVPNTLESSAKLRSCGREYFERRFRRFPQKDKTAANSGLFRSTIICAICVSCVPSAESFGTSSYARAYLSPRLFQPNISRQHDSL